jgi:hypothetical protein
VANTMGVIISSSMIQKRFIAENNKFIRRLDMNEECNYNN